MKADVGCVSTSIHTNIQVEKCMFYCNFHHTCEYSKKASEFALPDVYTWYKPTSPLRKCYTISSDENDTTQISQFECWNRKSAKQEFLIKNPCCIKCWITHRLQLEIMTEDAMIYMLGSAKLLSISVDVNGIQNSLHRRLLRLTAQAQLVEQNSCLWCQ